MDATSNATTRHRCATCSKVFKNSSHLRRHEHSHTRAATHQCTFCSRHFLRHDALRRHSGTCASRVEHDNAIPVAKRGRKARACHNCQSKKLQCDGRRPCRQCSSKKIECAADTSDPPEVLITLLRNYTDPGLASVSDAFWLSEAHPEPSFELGDDFSRGDSYIHGDWMEDLFAGVLPALSVKRHMEFDNIPATSKTIHTFLSLPSQSRTESLVSLLTKQCGSETSGHFPVGLAGAVFTSNNIAEYVSAFFNYFHPHVPFIHRPSFDVENVVLPLLLGVLLVGSIFCTPQDDALAARHFFDPAEDYIFGLLHKATPSKDDPAHESMQLLQAAVLMHALQMDSNNDDVRLRVRECRFPAIVATLRHLKLFSSVRGTLSGPGSWEQFIREEERVRLAARVFQIDCMSTLFFKTPLHITVAEMDGPLPCDDVLFDASTPAEFLEILTESEFTEPSIRSLKDKMALLLGEAWTGPDVLELASIGPEYLANIMFVLHALIFTSRSGLLMPSTHRVLLRATHRWKELWQLVQARDNSNKRRPIGFAKHGLELWWLAQKILKLTQQGTAKDSYMTNTPTNSLRELHDFIQQYALRQPA